MLIAECLLCVALFPKCCGSTAQKPYIQMNLKPQRGRFFFASLFVCLFVCFLLCLFVCLVVCCGVLVWFVFETGSHYVVLAVLELTK